MNTSLCCDNCRVEEAGFTNCKDPKCECHVLNFEWKKKLEDLVEFGGYAVIDKILEVVELVEQKAYNRGYIAAEEALSLTTLEELQKHDNKY